MNVPKRTRPKLLKAQMAKGAEFYYSRKPSTRPVDHAQPVSKDTKAKVVTVQTKKK